MNKVLYLMLSCVVALCCECGVSPVAGGSSQQGNGVMVGSVVSTNGAPAIATQILIRPTDYVQTPEDKTNNKKGVFDAITDSKGHFTVARIPPGRYAIEANDLTVSAAIEKATVEKQDSIIDIGTMGLKPYARIAGRITRSATGVHSSLFVQVQGLERYVPVEQNGTFSITDLPEGDFNLQIIAIDSSIARVNVAGIDATSGESTAVVIPTGWRHSHKIHLNTTATGADIRETVTNFPLLVRLTSTNFDFGQARTDGTDIRFTKVDSMFLPYDIECWDAITGHAEIWVKVDTILGNDSLQSIMMHWGNPEVVDGSDGAAVFDTTDNVIASWHLGESGDSVFDATGNSFDGRNSGCATVPGIIGNSKKFVDGNSIKIPGLLHTPSSITLSAWVNSDTSNRAQEVVSIGDAVLIRLDDINNMGTEGCYHNDSIVNDQRYAIVGSGRYLANTGWHYLAFTINTVSKEQKLYIDGVQCGSANDVTPINYTGLGTTTCIGIHGNGKSYFLFNGLIDEVRVYRTAKSADYVKLCFMNQRENEPLVIFR